MDNNFIKGAGLLIALAVLLRARYKTKAAKTRQEDVRNYEPIASTHFLSSSGLLLPCSVSSSSIRSHAGSSSGTAALILLIYTIYKNRKAEETADPRSTEFWEDRP
jgi:hypothetical protein